jgi:GH15 family glucan-1,4-alpha-glucosidase
MHPEGTRMTLAADAAIDRLAERSRALVLELQAPNGAYPASPVFSAYAGYCWFRDGAFIADGMSADGALDSATAFFDWCASVLERHRDRIVEVVEAAERGEPLSDERMLPARFTMDGELGQDEWWDFQLDGYGTWVWAAAAHAGRGGPALERWTAAIRLTVDYLLSSWSRPCYDWWEEHVERVHVSTLGCVAAGLAASADAGVLTSETTARARSAIAEIGELIRAEGVRDGHLVKWLGADAVDGSLLALIEPLGVVGVTDPVALATADRVEADLGPGGGVHRYVLDTYYGGGQWPLLSCFLGLARVALGDRPAAERILDWVAATATADGDLPEQVDHHLLAPERRREWVDRWGPVASPLLWSHGMFLRLRAELAVTAGAAA